MKTVERSINDLHTKILGADFYPFKSGQTVLSRYNYSNTFMYIIKGKGKIRMNEQEWNVQEFDMFYMEPGTLHSFKADLSDPMVHACVYADLVSPSTSKQKNDRSLNSFQEEYDPELCAARVSFTEGFQLPNQISIPRNAPWINPYLAVIEAYPEQSLGIDVQLRAQFESFLIPYIHHTLKPFSFFDPRVMKMIQWMEEEVPASLSITDWAKKFSISTAYLYELFHKQTGTGPQAYLIKLKLEKAKTILRETDRSITEIAEMVGFSSLHYFVRQFTNHYQESPSRYRKRFRGYL